jgi:hypothetical protein
VSFSETNPRLQIRVIRDPNSTYFCPNCSRMNTQQTEGTGFYPPITLLYGLAEKSYFDMNEAERKQAAAAGLQRAKEAAFTRGLPIIYGENGLVIAEYLDGRKFVRENGKDIRPYDGK